MICKADSQIALEGDRIWSDCRQLSDSGGLEGDAELIASLATGASFKKAAQRVGVSERTVQRRWRDPDFQREVHAARRLCVEQAVGKLASSSTMAADTLLQLLSSDVDMVRLAAARTILDLGSRLRAEVELEQRLFDLEERVHENAAKSNSANPRP